MSDTDERRLDAQVTQAQTPEHIRTDGVIRSISHEVGQVFSVKANVLSEHNISDAKAFRILFQGDNGDFATTLFRYDFSQSIQFDFQLSVP